MKRSGFILLLFTLVLMQGTLVLAQKTIAPASITSTGNLEPTQFKSIPIEGSYIRATLIKVSDGDTMKVSIEGVSCPIHKNGVFTIRLYGVDTMESRINDKAKKDSKKYGVPIERIIHWGNVAKGVVVKLIPVGSSLHLTLAYPYVDKYGRLLGVVELPGESLSLNHMLINMGLALPFMVSKKNPDADLYSYHMGQAMNRDAGIWAEFPNLMGGK